MDKVGEEFVASVSWKEQKGEKKKEEKKKTKEKSGKKQQVRGEENE